MNVADDLGSRNMMSMVSMTMGRDMPVYFVSVQDQKIDECKKNLLQQLQ